MFFCRTGDEDGVLDLEEQKKMNFPVASLPISLEGKTVGLVGSTCSRKELGQTNQCAE